MKYLNAEQVLFIHSRLLDETGGLHGILDLKLLLSAVERPKASYRRKDLYKDIFHKSAALMESLIKNYPFIDGNKRTAITSTGMFLQLNGHILNASQKDLEKFTLHMATNNATVKEATLWLKQHSTSKNN